VFRVERQRTAEKARVRNEHRSIYGNCNALAFMAPIANAAKRYSKLLLCVSKNAAGSCSTRDDHAIKTHHLLLLVTALQSGEVARAGICGFSRFPDLHFFADCNLLFYFLFHFCSVFDQFTRINFITLSVKLNVSNSKFVPMDRNPSPPTAQPRSPPPHIAAPLQRVRVRAGWP